MKSTNSRQFIKIPVFFYNLKLGTKLSVLIITGIIGLAIFAISTFTTLNTVQINGPLYKQLTQNHELVADVLPPPSYIIESYLNIYLIMEAANDNDFSEIDELIKNIAVLQNDFETRHQYWEASLNTEDGNPEIAQALLIESYEPAQEFYRITNEEFIPEIKARDLEAAHVVLHDKLAPIYNQHRAAIDNVVTLQREQIVVNETSAQNTINNSTIFLIVVALMTALVASWVGTVIVRSITIPVNHLSSAADEITRGNLNVEVNVESKDEIGSLASSFKSMTNQLRNLIGSLETRVADRTKALATSVEVSRRLSTILDKNQLLNEVVEQVKNAFNYYHVHIYLLDKESGNLIMAGGTGEAGKTMLERKHYIQKGRGLVGRASETNAPVLVSDTKQDPAWLPNPLLPETASEIAVPISIGNDVLGVLDVQHNIVNGLQQEDIDLIQSLANQTAIALQNATSYAEAQERANRERLIASIGQKIQSATSVEAVLQIVAREVGQAIQSPLTVAQFNAQTHMKKGG